MKFYHTKSETPLGFHKCFVYFLLPYACVVAFIAIGPALEYLNSSSTISLVRISSLFTFPLALAALIGLLKFKSNGYYCLMSLICIQLVSIPVYVVILLSNIQFYSDVEIASTLVSYALSAIYFIIVFIYYFKRTALFSPMPMLFYRYRMEQTMKCEFPGTPSQLEPFPESPPILSPTLSVSEKTPEKVKVTVKKQNPTPLPTPQPDPPAPKTDTLPSVHEPFVSVSSKSTPPISTDVSSQSASYTCLDTGDLFKSLSANFPPRNKKIIFLSVALFFACALSMAFGIAYLNSSNRIEQLKSNYSVLETEINKLKNSYESIVSANKDLLKQMEVFSVTVTDNAEKAWFLNTYVVFVTPEGKKYHTYDCHFFKNSDSYWAYNVEAVEYKGYFPCSICYNKNNSTILSDARTWGDIKRSVAQGN